MLQELTDSSDKMRNELVHRSRRIHDLQKMICENLAVTKSSLAQLKEEQVSCLKVSGGSSKSRFQQAMLQSAALAPLGEIKQYILSSFEQIQKTLEVEASSSQVAYARLPPSENLLKAREICVQIYTDLQQVSVAVLHTICVSCRAQIRRTQ